MPPSSLQTIVASPRCVAGGVLPLAALAGRSTSPRGMACARLVEVGRPARRVPSVSDGRLGGSAFGQGRGAGHAPHRDHGRWARVLAARPAASVHALTLRSSGTGFQRASPASSQPLSYDVGALSCPARFTFTRNQNKESLHGMASYCSFFPSTPIKVRLLEIPSQTSSSLTVSITLQRVLGSLRRCLKCRRHKRLLI